MSDQQKRIATSGSVLGESQASTSPQFDDPAKEATARSALLAWCGRCHSGPTVMLQPRSGIRGEGRISVELNRWLVLELSALEAATRSADRLEVLETGRAGDARRFPPARKLGRGRPKCVQATPIKGSRKLGAPNVGINAGNMLQ